MGVPCPWAVPPAPRPPSRGSPGPGMGSPCRDSPRAPSRVFVSVPVTPDTLNLCPPGPCPIQPWTWDPRPPQRVCCRTRTALPCFPLRACGPGPALLSAPGPALLPARISSLLCRSAFPLPFSPFGRKGKWGDTEGFPIASQHMLRPLGLPSLPVLLVSWIRLGAPGIRGPLLTAHLGAWHVVGTDVHGISEPKRQEGWPCRREEGQGHPAAACPGAPLCALRSSASALGSGHAGLGLAGWVLPCAFSCLLPCQLLSGEGCSDHVAAREGGMPRASLVGMRQNFTSQSWRPCTRPGARPHPHTSSLDWGPHPDSRSRPAS